MGSLKFKIIKLFILSLIIFGFFYYFLNTEADIIINEGSQQATFTPNIAPTDEQVKKYINEHNLTITDIKSFENYAIVLSNGTIHTLSTDKSGTLYHTSQFSSGANNDVSYTRGSIGNSYIVIFIYNNDISMKAESFKIVCEDNTVIEVKSNKKEGQIIQYPGTISNFNKVKKVIIFDSDKNILFESKAS